MNGSNIVDFNYANITHGFQSSVSSNVTTYTGHDWTKPYPGAPVDGFTVRLNVSSEVYANASAVGGDLSTVLSSLTFGTPSSLMSGATPRPMDPSWSVCRHIFVSTNPGVKAAVDGGSGCAFLPSACLADLKQSLTSSWGAESDTSMCSQLSFDIIPQSCLGSFGLARQAVWEFNNQTLSDTSLAGLHTLESQQPYSFRLGTGYNVPGNPRSYAFAANRTYLVATAWGQARGGSSTGSNMTALDVSLSCLSSGPAYVPPPPPVQTTTTTTPAVPPPTATPISNTVAHSEYFSDGNMVQWTTYDGTFNATSGKMAVGSSNGGKALLSPTYTDFSYDAVLSLAADSPSGNANANAGVIFRASNPQVGADAYDGYFVGISAAGVLVLGKASHSWTALQQVSLPFKTSTDYHLRIVAIGSQIAVYVDNFATPKIIVTDTSFTSGMVGVRVYQTGATFTYVTINPLLYQDNISTNGLSGWTTYDGDFITFGPYIYSESSTGAKAVIASHLFSSFRMEANVTVPSGDSATSGLLLRASSVRAGADGYYGYYLGVSSGYVVFGRSDNAWTQLARYNIALTAGAVTQVKVEAVQNIWILYVGDMNQALGIKIDGTYGNGLNGVRGVNGTFLAAGFRVYAL